MDGMNFISPNRRPEQRPERQPEHVADSAADMVRHAAGALAIFAAIMLATFGGIALMDRLGIPLSVLEIGADP
jgi:hypothetical protein